MALAIEQAVFAEQSGEVPVGAVIVKDGIVIGSGHNRTLVDRDPTAHAEVVAIRAASRAIGNHRLVGCTLYVTLEPCAMCMGAVLQSRVERVYFGASDPKTGACGSVLDLSKYRQINPHCSVYGGLSQDVCSHQLASFFRKRRLVKLAAHEPLREDALRLREGHLDTWMGGCTPLTWNALNSSKGLRVRGWSNPGSEEKARTLLFCLHGVSSWSYIYRDLLLAKFPRDIAAWAIDLPGHGGSDKTKHGAELDSSFQLSVLEEILASCPFDRVHVFAHDSGCRFAIDLAERRKDLVRGLTLISPATLGANNCQTTKVPRSLRQLYDWYYTLSGCRADFAKAMCAQYPDAGHSRGFLQLQGKETNGIVLNTTCEQGHRYSDLFHGLPGSYACLIDLNTIHGNE